MDAVICGGIGPGAKMALADVGIKLYPGVMGNADALVDALLAGNLEYKLDVVCNHHGEGHDCGHHGHCGGNCHD